MMVSSAAIYFGAALAEIAGCFAFWAWLKLDKSPLWIAPGMISLAIFASLLWLWIIENQKPDRWDVAGGLICLTGAAIILWAPRPT